MSTGMLLSAEAVRPRGEAFPHSLSYQTGSSRIVCLVGPDGAGKTTWLRMLAGVDLPAAGRLQLLGMDVMRLDTPAWRRLRCRAAFINAGAPLLSVVDGFSNVTLPALYHRLGTAAAVRVKALETLEFLGYTGRRDALPAFLNSHERLLLAIARCLMLSPELLFLDEPFHMADDACRRREAEIYLRLKRERNLTVLVATHNLGFVKRYADDIVFIHPQGAWPFPGWTDFAAATLPAVRGFLDAAA